MKIKETKPRRIFTCGPGNNIKITDCAKITLEADEQVTFLASNAEYDVVRKSWGFYATPSINSRLKRFGIRTVLVKGTNNKYFIMLVESGKEKIFNSYLKSESIKIISWLDTDEALSAFERKINA